MPPESSIATPFHLSFIHPDVTADHRAHPADALHGNAAEPQRLDPQVHEFLQQYPEAAFSTGDLARMREAYVRSRRELQAAPAALAAVEDRTIAGPGGPLPLRIYRPLQGTQAGPLPCLLYAHGGGFVLGNLESHDPLCRSLAAQGQCAVVAVDYRLAPEHRFPAAVEDVHAALRWVAETGQTHGFDTGRIAVGGDSAGGNLAAVSALLAREQGLALALQLLFYPVTDLHHHLPSHTLYGSGYRLGHANLLWYREQYLADARQMDDWRASPLRAADLGGLPPAFVITAGFDPLCDEGRRYAERLHEAGISVTHECFRGMIHGFMLMNAHLAAGHHALHRAGQALRSAFGRVRLPNSPRPSGAPAPVVAGRSA